MEVFHHGTLLNNCHHKLRVKGKTLVFLEGEDVRIQGAAIRLAAEELVKPILLGNKSEIEATAAANNFDLSGVQIVDPAEYPADAREKMVDALVERRNGKTDAATASKWLEDVNYFGTMLVYLGVADGMVSGATHQR